jgi:hypothetical protein
MPAFNALSVRDLVALTVIASESVRVTTTNADELVARAFAVADAFVNRSDGLWSHNARQAREKRDG